MNYIYDKKYPVTSILLILTTLVFVGMLILRGFSYAEAQTVFEFGAVYSPTIIMNPIQIWRLFSAIFVHIGLEHFVVNVITLYFIGRQAEDIFWLTKFLSALYDVWPNGKYLCLLFQSRCSISRSFNRLVWTFCLYRDPALCRSRQLHSAAGAVLYDLDCGQYHL